MKIIFTIHTGILTSHEKEFKALKDLSEVKKLIKEEYKKATGKGISKVDIGYLSASTCYITGASGMIGMLRSKRRFKKTEIDKINNK